MRKVLSFVLVLALVLSSFSMAFAADSKATAGLTDVAGNANQDAIQVAFDLGIVTGNPDGTFLPDKAVNRAEFAAMLTRALDIPDSALAGYTTTSFKDTTGYTWAVPYLAFCQSKGILLGDGAGNVMPGRTITVNEAMTMALRAIGYTANSSLLVGVWPANYVSIAQNESLYDDVAKDTTVNKASAAQIIYNLLTVQKVAVNSDGTTDYLWKDKAKEVASNLLNTNLGCTEHDDLILGNDNYDYSNSLVNITSDIGAFGDAYTNSDGDLVAFTKHDGQFITGKVSDDQKKFEVGDVDYDFGTNTFVSDAAFFTNATLATGVYAPTTTAISAATIDAFATAKADGQDTVTLFADVSGKKIKDIYSVSAWKATSKMLASSDVQEDIADASLNGSDFAQNDDDAIDMNKFELLGVKSLDDIAKDNVVYVYEATDSDQDIRRVAVGTETVDGAVNEIEMDDLDVNASTITIGDKDYDVSALATTEAKKVDTDSEGKFYIDAYGEIYDFDGTNGVDTYAVVKANKDGDSFNNVQLKLYKSDDSTSSYYLSEDNATKIDWTTNAAHSQNTMTATHVAINTGDLVGYSLNNDGDVDALNVSAGALGTSEDAYLQSAKVLKVTSTLSYKIDPSAVVFTYAGSNFNGDYDVAKIADIDAGTKIATSTTPGQFILNDDGDVVALFVNKDLAKIGSDDIYGVLNGRFTAKNSDSDACFKFTGYIDGKEFSYLTDDDDSGYKDFSKGMFGVYAITVDASNQITKIAEITNTNYNTGSAKLVGAANVTALDDDNTVMTIGSDKYTVDDSAVVYKYSTKDKAFTTSKLSAIDKGDTVTLYDTKDDDADGVANVVIYIAN